MTTETTETPVTTVPKQILKAACTYAAAGEAVVAGRTAFRSSLVIAGLSHSAAIDMAAKAFARGERSGTVLLKADRHPEIVLEALADSGAFLLKDVGLELFDLDSWYSAGKVDGARKSTKTGSYIPVVQLLARDLESWGTPLLKEVAEASSCFREFAVKLTSRLDEKKTAAKTISKEKALQLFGKTFSTLVSAGHEQVCLEWLLSNHEDLLRDALLEFDSE